MPCSITKLKSHMLFTCKSFMFSDFTWKNVTPENVGEGGGGGAGTPCPPPFLYGPDETILFCTLWFYLIPKSVFEVFIADLYVILHS